MTTAGTFIPKGTPVTATRKDGTPVTGVTGCNTGTFDHTVMIRPTSGGLSVWVARERVTVTR
jgi:hypothetical protein